MLSYYKSFKESPIPLLALSPEMKLLDILFIIKLHTRIDIFQYKHTYIHIHIQTYICIKLFRRSCRKQWEEHLGQIKTYTFA